MSNPNVTIIIPTYNRSFYLQQAIASVQNQSFREWELIVIDDGSTDDTESVMIEVCLGDPRIIYTRQKNLGAGAARNRGLEKAKGRYIAFLDSDDRYLPGGLGLLVSEIEFARRKLVYGDYLIFDESDRTTHPIRAAEPLPRPRLPLQFLIPRANPILPSATIVEKKALEEIGGFDESFRTGQVVELWSRFVRNNDIHRLGRQVTIYRKHPGQITKNIVLRRYNYDRIGLKLLSEVNPVEWFPSGKPMDTARALDDLARHLIAGKFALVDTALCLFEIAQTVAPLDRRRHVIAELAREADAILLRRYGDVMR